jgi:hypothetical protein
MRGEARNDVALDPEQGVVAMGGDEREKGRRHPGQRPARAFERAYGVAESRRGRLRGDRRDLAPMAGERRVEGGGEMLGADRTEGRYPEWRRPVGEERVIAVRRRRGGGIDHG